MTGTDLEVEFNESFERCVNDPLFLDKFYEIFLLSSDEVKLMFIHTDMETQKAVLITSMAYMTSAYRNKSSLLTKIAERHNKNNLNIKPHLYPLWLNSLIEAANFIDPLFDNHTEKMRRKIMQPGIDFMIDSYNQVQ